MKLNSKKTNYPLKKWAKDPNRQFTKVDTQVAKKYMKRCSISYVASEMEIKLTVRYHYIFIRMAKIQNTDNTKCWWATGILIHCCWECKMVQPLWKTVWWFLTKLNILLLYVHQSHFLVFTKNVYTDDYSSFIHNCQNLEATKMSFSKWMDKQC